MPGLVIFDCDGVLIDSEFLACRVEAEVLGELGFPISPDEITAQFSGLSDSSMRRGLEERFDRPLPDHFEDLARERSRQVFERELEAIAGVADAVAAIDAPKCVASSSHPERLRHSLSLVGLLDAFTPFVFSAVEVKRGKPAPDLFLHAAARCGVDPGRCTVVEDSRFGVEAARAAGMRVLGFVGGRHCGPGRADELHRAGAHHVFRDMAELSPLLAAGA
ncbi:MAG: HAD family hydrolase [Myxococcota bacterium]